MRRARVRRLQKGARTCVRWRMDRGRRLYLPAPPDGNLSLLVVCPR
ncbi:uncharacterized protein CTRU02_205957 [Colletotrichum truncatum]|uniref:Uncharacterized protein n=1 Tax=Colletotrichum truncatum TaxID=5467 RepID=A0ACC3Z5H2_COLTU|nr:uncharacterized protein CTRU02_04789 [Colletotrichum truncatum]KAF6795226.1 hypothetical protein CTRU02_04789 [Colletotrichum truncatum]